MHAASAAASPPVLAEGASLKILELAAESPGPSNLQRVCLFLLSVMLAASGLVAFCLQNFTSASSAQGQVPGSLNLYPQKVDEAGSRGVSMALEETRPQEEVLLSKSSGSFRITSTGSTTPPASPRPLLIQQLPKRRNIVKSPLLNESAIGGGLLEPDVCENEALGSLNPLTEHKDGITVTYNAASMARWAWFGYATWERATFGVLERFVPDRVVLDVGAWVGQTVLWEAHLAKSVVALEPSQSSFRALCWNLAANSEGLQSRVLVFRAALGDEDRVAQVSNRGDSEDAVSIDARRSTQASVSVRMLSVPSLRALAPQLEEVGFVKIDVEGYESVVVPAMKAFLLEMRPATYVSLHPHRLSSEQMRGVIKELESICPFLYEADMLTRFDTKRATFQTHEDAKSHGGTDVLCTFSQL